MYASFAIFARIFELLDDIFFWVGEKSSSCSTGSSVSSWWKPLVCLSFAGLKLNCFTASTLIMTVGVAVDYTAHIGIVYLAASGSPKRRTTHALRMMFQPMLDGAFSTFIGLVPLAFSKYDYVVQYYFDLYVIIVALGLLVGLMLLPVMLSRVGAGAIGECSRSFGAWRRGETGSDAP